MSRIITSPGVEVREKDLSLRIETVAGTEVVVPGFASQGPTTEPVLITSVSELESVFGTPKTPAETYLYYSCREVLNSPAKLNVLRLPYGADGGSDYSKSYSGLFYPTVLTPDTVTTESYVAADRSAYTHSEVNYLVGGNAIQISSNTVHKVTFNTTDYYYTGNLGIGTSLYSSVSSTQTSTPTFEDATTNFIDAPYTNNLDEQISINGSPVNVVNLQGTQYYYIGSLKNAGLGPSSITLSAAPTESGGGSYSAGAASSLTIANTVDITTVTNYPKVNVTIADGVMTGFAAFINGTPSVSTTYSFNPAAKATIVAGLITPPNFKVSYILENGNVTSFSVQQLNVTTVTTGTSSWEIGAPQSIALSQEDYVSIQRGDFEWGTPSSVTTIERAGDALDKINSGFFVINTLQSTINEIGEGYYLGLADNTSALSDSPNFDSISKIFALSGSGLLSQIDSDRLDFSLSATKAQADTGKDSISEILEKVGFVGFESQDYIDHLSLGVFKIRRSVDDQLKLTLGPGERYLGSFDATRKVLAPTGGGLDSAYIEDIMNSKSSVVSIYVNPALSKQFQWSSGMKPVNRIKLSSSAKSLYPLGVYTPDSRLQDATKQIGNLPLKLDRALRLVENPEYFTCDVIVDAGLSTISSVSKLQDASGAVSFNDEFSVTNEETKDDWLTIANMLINFSQNTRKDCVSIIDPPRSIFIQGRGTKVLDLPNTTFTTDIYKPLREAVGGLESNYAAVYGNWVKNVDLFTGKKIWLPASGYVAAIFGRNDAVATPWSAPAGLNRGLIANILDVGFNPNQKQRDRLYELGVNPIVFFNGLGHAVYGQKTLQTKPTAFDRINVRRLFLYLERAVQKTIQYFVFEPNTDFTRHRVVSTISPVFNFAKQTEGIYDYMIVCDERNNTPDTIDNNELIVDIYIKPVRTAEFILLNFIATRTGQNFSELV